MQGEAGGDGGRVRRNTRKRDLDGATQDGLGVDYPSSKRRHTTGSPGPHDDKSTSNSRSFNSVRQKVKGESTLRSLNKSRPDTLRFSLRSSGSPAPQKHRFSKPPTSSDSAASPSAALGVSGGPWGAKPSLPGGFFNGQGHHKFKQTPVPIGPPTSSSTSSDASSIPATSISTLPSVTSKDTPRASYQSLRYGYKQANRAAAEEGSHDDKPGQEAKDQSHNTRHGATGSPRWQSEAQDNVPPSSRINGTRETPHAITSSEDGSYAEEDDEDSDDDAFPTTRQRSARLIALGSTGNFLKGSPDDGLNDVHEAKKGPYKTTPSGKDYHEVLGEALRWETRLRLI